MEPDAATPLLPRPGQGRVVILVGAAVCLAALVLCLRPLCLPMLSQDDFQILAQSWTWQRTRAGLWVPNNEHAMPLGRLLTYGLVRLLGRPTTLPWVAALVGPLALLAGLALVYRFVQRELRHPFYGLAAMTLFGVTAVYQQAVYWFAASFSVLALDTLLLALLAGQHWLQTGRRLSLALAVAGCALAPAWFASGILAGPLCSLYLLPGKRVGGGETGRVGEWSSRRGPSLSHSLLPLAGTALFLAVSLPLTAPTILHLEHYGPGGALEALNPRVGLAYSCRAVVDGLLLGSVGIWAVALPVPVVAVLLAALVAAAAWWWRQAPGRRLLGLGLGLVAGSYLLTYSARAAWDYVDMTESGWSRYHLLPQLGLALFVCGGLPGRAEKWFVLDETGRLTPRQVRALGLLIGLCCALQLPHAWLGCAPHDPAQLASLRQVEEIDARCRAQHISAETARRALPKLELEASGTEVNGLEFLHGSDNPRPLSLEEARHLLQGEQ